MIFATSAHGSTQIDFFLLKLTQNGMSRESSYEAVQRNAMIVWNEGKNFLELLKMDEVIRIHLSETELEGLFDISLHLKQIDVIFNRVFSEP